MADARFFQNAGPFSLQKLAEITGAVLADKSSATRSLADVQALDKAGEQDLTFLDNRKYRAQLASSKAGACILREEEGKGAPAGMALLITQTPYQAYAKVAAAFYPASLKPLVITESGIAKSAKIAASATVASSAVIGDNVEIGEGTVLGSGVVIGAGVVIGQNCSIGSGCVITHAVIGNNVLLHPGVKIGQDGFGFAPGPTGILKVPQLGRVMIADEVEIGANTTIDRGSGPDTVIGQGTKIDNLVQIGHNVEIGRYSIIVSQTGIAGSTKIGNGVILGGQCGVAGHLTIGDGVQIAAQSGIAQDVPAKAIVGGSPAVPIKQWHRQHLALAKMARKGARHE